MGFYHCMGLILSWPIATSMRLTIYCGSSPLQLVLDEQGFAQCYHPNLKGHIKCIYLGQRLWQWLYSAMLMRHHTSSSFIKIQRLGWIRQMSYTYMSNLPLLGPISLVEYISLFHKIFSQNLPLFTQIMHKPRKVGNYVKLPIFQFLVLVGDQTRDFPGRD